MDPYVVIEYMGTKVKSRTHEDGGKNPIWNQVSINFFLITTIRTLISLLDQQEMTFLSRSWMMI